MIRNIIIYGTLKTWADTNLTYLGTEQFSGCMVNLGQFPAVIAGAKHDSGFIGHVYQLPSEHQQIMAGLDAYEGVDRGLYSRELRATKHGDAYIYVMPPITVWSPQEREL